MKQDLAEYKGHADLFSDWGRFLTLACTNKAEVSFCAIRIIFWHRCFQGSFINNSHIALAGHILIDVLNFTWNCVCHSGPEQLNGCFRKVICILLGSSLKQTSFHTAVNICSFYIKIRCSEGDDGTGRFYLRSPHTHSAGSDPDTALWNLWWIHRWNHGWWKGDKKRHHSLDWWKIKGCKNMTRTTNT